MKGPQDIRREKEYNLLPDKLERNADDFDHDAKYLRQISALKEENDFLRSLSNRVQIELKEYQIRFPQLLVESNDHANMDDTCNLTPNGGDLPNCNLAPWSSSSKYMSPLLVAYDAKIKELNHQIKTYQEKALQIKKESDALIQRNQDLQNELETKVVSLYQKLKIHNSFNNINGIDDDDDDCGSNSEYQQRIHILNQQNQLLRESEVRSKKEKENYLKIIKENSQSIEMLQTELNRVNAMNNELDDVCKNVKYENGELREIHNDLRNNVVKKLNEKCAFLDERLRIETTQNNECRRRVNEYENEYITLNDNHNALSNKYETVSSENEALIRRIERMDNEMTEHKTALASNKERLQSMISSLESIENVLQIYKSKELEYLKQINDLKNGTDLFIRVEKDKLITENNGLKQDLARIGEEHRNGMSDAQKENEIKMERVTKQYAQTLEELNKNIDDLMTKNVTLSQQRHEFETKSNATSKDMNDIKKLYFNKFETLKTTQNELECRIKELESETQRYLDLSKRSESNLKQQSNMWMSERDVYNQSIAELTATDERKNVVLVENEKEILDLKQIIDRLNEKLSVDQIRNSKHVEQLGDKLNKTENGFMVSIENYKKEFKNLELLYNESQLQTKEIIQKHESLSTKWKEENRNSLKHLKQMIDELKKENKSLINRNLTLETQIQNTINDQKHAANANIHCKNKLKQTQNSIGNLNQTIQNLKSLNAKYQNKETLLLNENKNLRNQLNQSTISMQRLQRNHQFNLKINNQ